MNSVATLENPLSTKPAILDRQAIFSRICYILAFLPPVVLLLQLINYNYQLPYADDLLFVHLLEKFYSGNVTIKDLWVQNNDHRMLTWRLVILLFIKLNGYNLFREVMLSFVLALLTLFALWRLQLFTLAANWRGPALLVASLAIFSNCQCQNWIWSFQTNWFLVDLEVILTLLMLSYRPVRPRNFGLALLVGVLATYTAGSALMLWPAFLFMMVLDWSAWRWKYILLWVLTLIAVYSIYLINYYFHPTTQESYDSYLLHHPVEFIVFFLNYMGTPIAWWGQQAQGAMWFGIVFVSASVSAGGWIWWQSRRGGEGYLAWQAAWPWLALFLFGSLGGALLTFSRVSHGIIDSFTSRYTPSAVLAWLGGVVALLVIGRYFWLTYFKLYSARLRWVALGSVSLVAIGLLVSYSISYANRYQQWVDEVHYVNMVKPFFYDYKNAPSPLLEHLAGDGPWVRQAATIVEHLQVGPFAPSEVQNYQQQITTGWQQKIQNEHYHSTVFPADQAQILYGKVDEVKPDQQQLNFIHSGKEVVETDYDLNKFYQQIGQPKQLQNTVPLEIETTFNTQFLIVYYDTGRGFNSVDMAPLLYTDHRKGQRYFRTELPTGVKKLQIETHYETTDSVSDNLKLTLYLK